MNPGDPQSANAELENLLAEIHLRLRQGLYDQAESRLQEARRLAPDSPIVLELAGDLAFARRRFAEAKDAYENAFAQEPENPALEEKFATAVVKVHEPEFLAHALPDDSLWGERVPRPPLTSGFLSFLFPGLGQWYNGEVVKGGIFIVVQVLLVMSVLMQIGRTLKAMHFSGTVGELVARFLQEGTNWIVLLLMAGIWVYSIVDAVLVARETR